MHSIKKKITSINELKSIKLLIIPETSPIYTKLQIIISQNSIFITIIVIIILIITITELLKI